MELLVSNYFDTTTQAVVNSSTATVSYLKDPDILFQYTSDGYANDLTTTSIRINFDETLSVSRIGLAGMNLKAYTVFYNGLTANTFAMTSTSDTNASNYASNSDTSQFLTCTPVNCTSVTLDLKSTIVANQEKAIGYLYVGASQVTFDRPPSAKNYKPAIEPKQVIHKLSDGSIRIQHIDDKREFKLKYKHITKELRDNLKTAFDLKTDFVFAPFGTTTGWDGVIAPVVWQGGFDFYSYSDNASDAGFEGTIDLKETSV